MLKLLPDAPRITACGLHRFLDPPFRHVEMARPHTQGITVVNIYLFWQGCDGANEQGHFDLSKMESTANYAVQKTWVSTIAVGYIIKPALPGIPIKNALKIVSGFRFTGVCSFALFPGPAGNAHRPGKPFRSDCCAQTPSRNRNLQTGSNRLPHGNRPTQALCLDYRRTTSP